jgi:hypothetical protein
MPTPAGIVEIPSSIKEYIYFNEKFFTKHAEMGAQSPLLGITDVDWTAMQTAAEHFVDRCNIADACAKQSYQATEIRNLAGEYLTKFVNNAKNLLKVLNYQNLRALTDWGFTVSTEGRGTVSYPTKAKEFGTFFADLLAKHDEIGNNSPLLRLPEMDWDKIRIYFTLYNEKNNEMEAYLTQSQQANSEKEVLRATLHEAQTRAKNYLKTLNKDNVRALMDWGFTVTAANKSKTKSETKSGQTAK